MTVRGPSARRHGPDPAPLVRPGPSSLTSSGAKEASVDRYDADEVYRHRAAPLDSSQERTGSPGGFGTGPIWAGTRCLFVAFPEASGSNILTPTGYYGASRWGSPSRPCPRRVGEPRACVRWLREWRDGIRRRASGRLHQARRRARPLPEVHRRLVRPRWGPPASGLTIAAHSGDGVAALEPWRSCAKEGVDGSAFIWVHANARGATGDCTAGGQAGAWVEFDGIGPK